MKILIDTNILLDFVFKRAGHGDAARLFHCINARCWQAFMTATTVTDLFYIIRKESKDTEKAYAIMEQFFKLINVLGVSANDVTDAFLLHWKDFEDCLQTTTAANNAVDCIITNNIADFGQATLPIFTPGEFLDRL